MYCISYTRVEGGDLINRYLLRFLDAMYNSTISDVLNNVVND